MRGAVLVRACRIRHPNITYLRYDVYKSRGASIDDRCALKRPIWWKTAAFMNIETPQQLSAPIAEFSPPLAQLGLFAATRQWIVRMSTTRANGQAGLIADVGTSVVLLGAGLWRGSAQPLAAISTMLLGLVLFSFIEYGFHRWLFHGSPQIMEQGHRKHHEQPNGYDALPFFLPPLGLLAITGFLILILPAQFALLLSGSLAAGYAAYGLSHAAIHNLRFRNPLSKRWAAIHHIHHYHPDKNFGVTTPLWDILLGTRYVSAGKGLHAREAITRPSDV
jgi:sterol desaturase/sphingolipid hydroxylase (fatty acid hydroxylase superfamily)